MKLPSPWPTLCDSMAPEPHRGKVAQPAMTPLVAKKVWYPRHARTRSTQQTLTPVHCAHIQMAELKGISVAEVIRATTENARTVYSLPKREQ